MRKVLLVLVFIIVLICASCVDAQVYYGLYDNHTVETQYTVTIKSNELKARAYAEDIKKYWSSKGMDATVDRLEDSVSVVGKISSIYSDRALAANAYADVLTAKDSLLSNVVFEFMPSYELDRFSLSATLSLDDVVRQNEIQDIPQQDLLALLERAKRGEYTFCLSLPGEIVSTNADVVDDEMCTWTLEYGKTTEIELVTQKTNTQNIIAYKQLQEQHEQSSRILRISIVTAAALCLAIVLFIVIRLILRRRR